MFLIRRLEINTTEMESENKNIGNLTGQANLDKKLKKERGGKREGERD